MKQTELNQILKQHKLWVDGKGGKCANLTGANLTGAYLTHADLQGANLENANLRGANLENANLRGAYLGGANLNGADLTDANLNGADLTDANLRRANLIGANLRGACLYCANLTGAIGLPNVSWVIPGCLVQLNNIMHGFYLKKENKWENFGQGSFGFFIQDNREEGTFDMLLGDRIIRNIPYWVKYYGMKQIESESV